MIHGMTTIVCICMVAVNVPGMLEGRPWAIAAGLFCAVGVGITGAWAIESILNERRNRP